MNSDKMADEQETLVKGDYYAGDAGKKVLDFCLGFFAPGIAEMVLAVPLVFLSLMLNFEAFGLFFHILILILAIFFFIKFRKTRRYISIGLLCSVLIPLLLFGACMIIFVGFN